MSRLKIGMIGLDTSHVVAFTELLNDARHPYHVPGGQVVAAFPGGSPDFELSASRVEGFTAKLRDEFGVSIVDSPEAVAEASDAVLLESVDGRVHLEQFRRIVSYGKPVFIDKPLAVRSDEANEIYRLAEQHGVPVMSSSALRYAEALTAAVADDSLGGVIGADVFGPMAIQPTQPGLFWYGIHMADMLFTVLGGDCVEVSATTTEQHDVVVGTWADGRIGTIRGNRSGNNKFAASLHREQGSVFVDVSTHPKPYYASLLERIMEMFTTGVPPIRPEETLRLIRFLEAANESRETAGRLVRL